MIYCFLGDDFGFFPATFRVLFCSMVLDCSTNLKRPDRVFSGASCLTGSVFDGDIAHSRSEAVLCMLHKIRCDPVHPLYDVVLGP